VIVIDESAWPTRNRAELRAAADRHTRRFRQHRRQRTAAGVTGTALLVVLMLLATNTAGPETGLRTTRPADPGTLPGEAAVVEGDSGTPARSTTTTSTDTSTAQSDAPQSKKPAIEDAPVASPDTDSTHPRTKLLFVRTSGGLWELTLETGAYRKLHDSTFAGRWSPDGRFVVMDIGWDLIVLDAETGRTRVLFGIEQFEDESIGLPAWMPDGTAVVFEYKRRTDVAAWATELWTVDVGTGAARRLREGSAPSVARDGRILYRCQNNGWCLTDATGAHVGAFATSLQNAVISPDGRWMAGDGTTDTGSGLVVQRLDGGGRRVLAENTWGRPAWFPDGSRLAFTHNPPRFPEPDADDGIWSVRTDGTDLRRLTAGGGGGDDELPDLVQVS
jgi:Tol biopolymer transport system component